MTASKTVFTFLMTPTATVWRMSRTAKRPSGGLGESLHHHGLGGNHLNKPCITILQELGLFLKLLARSPVNLGQYLSKLNSNVGGVAVQNRGIAISDLTRVVHDDDLGGEVGCPLFKPLDNMLVNISKLADQVTWEGTYDVEIGLGKKNNFWVTPRYLVVQVKVFNVQ